MARRTRYPHDIERLVRVVPTGTLGRTHLKRDYARRVRDEGVPHLLLLRDLDRETRRMLPPYIMVTRRNVKPGSSFSVEGGKDIVRAASFLFGNYQVGIPTAVSCKFGNHRTRRVLYIFHRMAGADHQQAMARSEAPAKNGEALMELWEKRGKAESQSAA